MTHASLRVLLLADSHLGFDWTARPRVQRRRRGDDFFANYQRSLAPALAGEVDLLVHGGDLLFRSKVPASLVELAMAPLRRVAEAGVPVVLVPGNHERSHIPHGLLARHSNLHVLDRPRTVLLDCAGQRVAVAGFACERDRVRARFTELLDATGWREPVADLRLLCLHQAVEGAQVGPVDFTFRAGADVIRAAEIPSGLAALLSGHIHRHQVLDRDLRGRPLNAPVLYPGSIERTGFAERDEPKGYLLLDFEPGDDGGRLASWRFVELPARPMQQLEISAEELAEPAFHLELRARLGRLPADAVVQLRVAGPPGCDGHGHLAAARLRALAPATQNVEIRWRPREA